MKLILALIVPLLVYAQLTTATSASDVLEKRRTSHFMHARQYGGSYGGSYGGAAGSASTNSGAYPALAMQPMGGLSGMNMGGAGIAAGMPVPMAASAMSDSMGMASMPSMTSGSATPAASGAATGNDMGLVPGPGQVVVAPKQGDLRFVPFNINVKPGQNVSFIWGAGPHTVTQSSALSICNATQQPGAFKSGMQNAGFEFSVPVTDFSTVYYYCGVPNHCQKGMFGLINGAVAEQPSDSFGNFLDQWGAMNSGNQELINITIQITASVPAAAKWGSSLSIAQIEPWAVDWAMQQTLYTRQFFAQNPHLLAADVNGTSSTTSSSAPGGAPSPSSSSGGSAAANPTGSKSASSGAMAVHSAPSAALGVVVAFCLAIATLFLA
ncbi:hypothetical protein JCM10908_000263 [Rhodotorula pacifica]|uniref:cupredoxin domain-containing protein n=1 Tax=Rhodotorula pacifica TaxID=1495444 RepID=UPI003172CBD7